MCLPSGKIGAEKEKNVSMVLTKQLFLGGSEFFIG